MIIKEAKQEESKTQDLHWSVSRYRIATTKDVGQVLEVGSKSATK